MSDENANALGKLVVDTTLASGLRIRVRAIYPGDADRLREGIGKFSPQSRYFRFFTGASEQPASVIESLTSVDGVSHLAWGALDLDHPETPAIAAVHAIRSNEGEPMEFSVGVLDDYQGQGLSKLLSGVLFAQCLERGEEVLIAHVLEENARSKIFIAHLGGKRTGTEASVATYRIDVREALRLLLDQHIPGEDALIEALSPYVER